jgi:hypothetical protein
MDIRAVLRHTCDEHGAIAFLFGEWGAVASATAIEQIEVGACSYFLPLPRGAVAVFQPVEKNGTRELGLFATSGEPVRVSEYATGRMGP